MTPNEFSQLRALYEQALGLNGTERTALLDQECRQHPGLRAQVEQLLHVRERVPTWLDRPIIAAAPTQDRWEPPDLTGRSLSGYTLVREIGRGGMGLVYLAERSDGAFHKQAAIKLLLPSAQSTEILARFQQEREILASLDHPHIARLLDGGATEEGWPYFVMEYVDGQPIHRYCDDHQLNLDQRIQLFRDVLAAVRYAHQRLVVHRDLKPGNILVRQDGTVKLLDFGIAKLVNPSSAAVLPDTVTLTQAMTPEYASPEQVNGQSVTTLSDVYSLGVILYELLTGHRPYRLLRAALHEMARVIAEEEPARPSEVVTRPETTGLDKTTLTPETVCAGREGDLERLRKRLAGDLDSILLRALRKEPDHRYSSAESFSDDLQRHLDHLPVQAREATPWYRFKRLCARHPDGVLAALMIQVSFVGSGLAVILQARHDLAAAAQDAAHRVFLAPVILYFATIGVVGASLLVYFLRPRRRQLWGSAAGGVVWGTALLGKWWLEYSLGWWHSRVPTLVDPLLLLAPVTWVLFVLLTATVLLLLALLGNRFGWKAQLLGLVLLGLAQESREHVWFSVIVPALTYEPGPVPIVGGALMITTGGLLGLLVMHWISARESGPPATA